jgi:hypothetical protein
MKLWQFTLPNYANDGASYATARAEWERKARERAGGLTHIGMTVGQWVDAGKLYYEPMQTYQVAASSDIADELLADAFELFPDQQALFRAEIGTASIVERPRTKIAQIA